MDALKVYCNKHLHLWCDEMHDLSSPSGAFGRVFRGIVWGQEVAIKTIRSEEWVTRLGAAVDSACMHA